MAAVQGGLLRRIARTGRTFEYPLPDASLAPPRKPIVDGLVWTVFLRAILPAAADPQNMHDPAQNASIVFALGSGLVRRQMRDDLCPLLIIEPE
jgi:hypothetical protein